MQRARPVKQLLVEIGAIGRAEILDHEDPSLLVDARVAGGSEGIAQAYLGRIAATEHDIATEVVDHARLMPGRALYNQARSATEQVGWAKRGGRMHSGRVGRGRDRLAGTIGKLRATPPQVAQRTARYPQQEQIEHDKEAELQHHRDGLEVVHGVISKRISVEPISMRSPVCNCREPWTATPLTRTPFVESRSSI